MQDFHKLKVWEKAHALAIDVHRVVATFPRMEGVALIGQLRRAALSIPANIAEGAGKQGNAEFRRFLHMALGSAVETDYHLLAARDLGLLEPHTYDGRRMLCALIKKVTEAAESPEEKTKAH